MAILTEQVLKEPSLLGAMKRVIDPRILSDKTMFDILEFRVALEIGISNDIFKNITSDDIDELEKIVKIGEVLNNNEYPLVDEFKFHSKLYEITRNNTIMEFQEIIHPVLTFIKDKFKDLFEPINIELQRKGEIVTHADLFAHLRSKDPEGYKKAIEKHFQVYAKFLKSRDDIIC